MSQTGTGPPFWQLNHKHSAYFGAKSANFPPISTLGPLFLQIMDPALDLAIENKNIVHEILIENDTLDFQGTLSFWQYKMSINLIG